MAIKTATRTHGDFVLSFVACCIVGGLCFKGAQSLLPENSHTIEQAQHIEGEKAVAIHK